MSENSQDVIVAHCGLICSECGMFRKRRCEGCHSEIPKYRNCPVKKCNLDSGYTTCADCVEFPELKRCRKLSNLISKLFGVIFRTNRIANLQRIRETGSPAPKSDHA